jgi:RimJ/RimL family protein N-acetyltransferase
MIVGNRISLIPLNDACFDLTLRWINDPALRHLTGARYPVSKLEHEKWFRAHATDPDNKTYAIQLLENGKVIGLIGNTHYDKLHRITDIFFYIGEKDMLGKGFGQEAVSLFTDFCFKEMNIHKVCGFVYDYNDASRHVFERCGYSAEGVLSDHWYRDGRYHDVYVFGLINPNDKRESR